jgi:hypothetical protein
MYDPSIPLEPVMDDDDETADTLGDGIAAPYEPPEMLDGKAVIKPLVKR